MQKREISVSGGGGGTLYDFREAEAVMRVLQAGARTSFAEVREFEHEFAAYVNAKHALAVSNCVAALHLPLLAHGFQAGDEVICAAMTFRATANPAEVQGGNVRFVDALDESFNIDPAKIEEAITEKTKAMYPVHMCGQPCDMDPIMEIAGKHGILVIEDAAHAVGASYKGRMIGSIGDYTAFSFQCLKNMSTLGEGGMLTTMREDTYGRLKELRSNGPASLNYRMTEAQGAVGRVQLQKVAHHNALRKRNAEFLFDRLCDVAGIRPQKLYDFGESSYHLANVLVVPDESPVSRDEVLTRLKADYGVTCTTQYAPPVPFQDYYREKYNVQAGDYPVAERLAAQVLTLPIGPGLQFPEDLEYIVWAVKECVS